MTEIPGFIAVSPAGNVDIHNLARSEMAAWGKVVLPSNNRSQLEHYGWRVVPCKLIVEDGK